MPLLCQAMKPIVALVLAFLFLIGSLFPRTDMEEVFKIPNLVQHYLEHKEKATQGFSFLDFLNLHYGINSTHAQTHQKEHASVPMFHAHCAGLTFVLPVSYFMWKAIPEVVLSSLYTSFYHNTYQYLFSFSFLRPPRKN